MLEVVEQQQRLTVAELLQLTDSGGARDRGADELRRGQRREGHEEDAALKALQELGANLKAEPGFSAAAGTGERDEPRRGAEHLRQLVQLELTPHEWIRDNRQVCRVQGLQWREVAVPELVDALGRRQVLEA